MGTITSSNSSLILSIDGLFPVDQPIQGYAADDAFQHAAFEIVETRMGVDGVLSGGFVPAEKTLEITLQPDSPSIFIFDFWYQAQVAAREAILGNIFIAMPSIGKQFALTTMFLKEGQALPSAKKVLDPQKYTVGFQDVFGSPLF